MVNKLAEFLGLRARLNPRPVDMCEVKLKNKYGGLLSAVFLAVLFVIVFAPQSAKAAACSNNAVTTVNWSVAGNWSCGHVPVAADTVTIPNTSGLNVVVDTAAVGSSLTFTTGNRANTVSISGSNSLTISGAITINLPTGGNKSKAIAVAGGTLSAGSIALTGNSGGAKNYTDITISTGTVTVTGNITTAGTESRIIFSGSGTLNAGGTFMSGTAGTFTASTGRVNYNSASGQTVGVYAYNDLTFSGGGAKSMATGITIAGNLSIAPTGSATASIGTGLNISVATLTLGGNGAINGTWGSTSSGATYKNNKYFAATTGYLTVATDSRSAPTVTSWPTASSITYGQALASSTLSGGSASVAGSFAFTTPTTTPSAGTSSVSVTFTPTDQTLSLPTTGTTNITVATKALTVTGITANNKQYDGTTTSTLSGTPGTLVGIVGSDSVSLTGTAVGTFATSSIGTGITVTVSGQSLTGAQAGNYTLTEPTTTANITVKTLTVTGITAANKVYDRTTTSTLSGTPGTLVGIVGSDSVSLTGTAVGTFATSSVGTSITVTVSGQSLTGAQAGNYSLTEPTTSANITAKTLTVTGITANAKQYDGTTTSTLSGTPGNLVGVIGGDSVSLTGTAVGTFATSSVGTGITVTVSGQSLTGAQAGNYSLTEPTISANITVKTLTVSGITASNKQYDGTTTSTLSGTPGSLVGIVGSDSVSLSGTAVGTFATSSVGTGITVTVSGQSLTGAQAGNYSLTEPTTSANITTKTLTVTGITASSKQYDGTTTSTLSGTPGTLVGIVGSDSVSLTGTAIGTFATSSVGTGVTVTVSGQSLTGAQSGNYSLTEPTTSANITTKALTVSGITASNKQYDGTTTSTLSGTPGSLVGIVGSDSVSLTGTVVGTFATSSVGTGITVTISGQSLTGAQSGNYSLTEPTTSANITTKALTVTGITAANKQYDGTTTSTLSGTPGTLVGKVGSDSVSLTGTAIGTFATSSVGTGITVTVSGQSLTGAQAGNYSLTEPTTSANITAKALTVSGITANNKQYDGTTTSTLSGTPGSLVGIVGSDSVSLTGTAVGTFATSSIGTSITVTVSGQSLTGAQSGNYTLTEPTTSANITVKTLTVSGITANNKQYDGTTTSTLSGTPGSLVGIVGSDSVSLTGTAVGTFATSSVGTGIAVTVSGQSLTGAQAGNYSLTEPTTSANITTKTLTISGITANNKQYDGTTTSTLSGTPGTLVGKVGSDVVTLTGTAVGTFATSSVGTSITVTVSGQSLTGAQAGNYSLTEPTTTANITVKNLTISGVTASDKEYNRSAAASLNVGSAALVGVVSGDAVNLNTGSATGTFATANVGTGIAVTVSGLTISGASAANYSLTQPTTTASITAKNLTVTGITANNRQYDATAAASINTGSAALVGVISPDDVSLNTTSATGTFANANVGTGKTVTVSGLTLSGAQVGNYSLTQPTTAANITQKVLTVDFITANNKVYDGNVSATLNTGSASLVGKITGDDVILNTGSATGTFASSAVGTGKTVNVSGLTVSGTSSANYILVQPTATANITAKSLTVAGVTANNKQYDRGNTATLNTGSASLVGKITGDDVNLDTGSATGTFATAAVGTGITVTISGLTISGLDIDNYSLSQPTSSANITAKALAVTGITANNKTYDGNTAATLNVGSAALVGVISGDTVNLNTGAATGTFATASVGTGILVTVSGLAIMGPNAGNYSLTQPTTTADILNPMPTTTNVSPSSKNVGDAQFTLTVNGTNFVSTSVVEFNGSARTTTYVSSTQATAIIPASDLTVAGDNNITVTNPTPGGGTSNAQTFTVNNQVPTTTSISPASKTLGAAQFTLMVNGTNFVSSSTINFNGSARTTTLVSSTQATAIIPASDLTAAGTFNITVTNPIPGDGVSNAQTFTVNNPVPTTTNISPTAKSVGDAQFTLTVNGTNFVSSSTINVNSSPRTTTYVSSTQATAVIPASDLTVAADLNITVVNPAPGGGTSNAQMLTVNTNTPHSFTLDHSGTIAAGSRAVYNVTRLDQYSVPIVNGSSTVYLYSNSTGVNRKFYDAPINGNVITQVAITTGTATTTFYYYDEKPGTYTITASDNALAPDNGTGIIDATDSLVVTVGSLAKLTLNIPGNLNAGETLGYQVTRRDQFNNPVTASSTTVYLYSSSGGANKKFVNASSAGATITSVSIDGGSATSSFWYYDETPGTVLISASDNSFAPDGAAGIADATSTITVNPGATTQYILSNPGNLVAGNRLGYTVTRKDQFGNLATANTNRIYIYTSSTEANAKFYDAASGGAVLTYLDMTVGNATSSFWYYDQTPGTYTISASDNHSVPDGSTGIVDGTASVTVSPAAVSQLALSNPGSLVAGNRLGFAVTREDQFGNAVASGTLNVYLYSDSLGANKKFYNDASAGNQITSVTLNEGSSTLNFWYYDDFASTSTVTVSDGAGTANGAVGLTDALYTFTISPATTTKFLLTNPGDMVASSTLGYSVIRKDQFNNLVTAGSATVYLYSDSTGPKNFLNASSGGSTVSSVDFASGNSSVNFWYYDEGVGTWTITASDSSGSADGPIGITDANDQVVVSAIPIVPTRFVILPNSGGSVDGSVIVTVQAQDNAGSVDTTYSNDVTLVVSGSATGGGLVDIAHGVGTLRIYDTVAETVSSSLSDTQVTGLDATSVQSLVFTPGAVTQLAINNPGDMIAGNRLPYTLTRKDQYGNAVTAGSLTVNLFTGNSSGLGKFYDVGSAGHIITSITFTPGNATADFWYYDEQAGGWTITASDGVGTPNGNVGLKDASDPVTVATGNTAQYILTNPGNMTQKTRLGYTVSRKDAFGNPVTSGAGNVYLYTDSTGPANFFTAASGGSTVTLVTFTAGSSTVNFWYYDEAVGSWVITASDNSGAPDGATGIADATDTIAVSSSAIVATKFVILPVGNTTVNNPLTVTIEAQDDNGNIDTTFQRDVRLNTSGSATGGGLVNIVNGIGTMTINDLVSEAVTLTLEDTQSTGLNVDSSQVLPFAPVSGSGGGSGAEAPAPVLILPKTSLIISGKAYPGAVIFLVEKNTQGDKLIKEQVNVTAKGDFKATNIGLPVAVYTYSLLVKDKNGDLAQTKVFQVDLTVDPSITKSFFIPPTADLLRTVMTRGDFVKVSGYAAPGAAVQADVDGNQKFETTAGADGAYQLLISTANMPVGSHAVKARQQEVGGVLYSDYSATRKFAVSSLALPKADMNGDGKIDVADLSIFSVLWKQKDPKADMNNDGKIDAADLSIFLRAVK
ncbi:MAG: YDG domain-containing protein [Candidatus Falkowbacteria bacterium]